MIINFLNKLNGLNEWLFHGFDSFVENFGFPEWIADAIIDSFHILPFLFVVFVFIELFEYYYAHKINHFMKETEKAGPVVGSLASIVPQCGFSIIASSLYSGRLITKGTLIAIYLATSDEAIPVLLARPDKVWLVVPVITVKLVVAIIAGYLIDFIFKTKIDKDAVEEIPDEGCCKHTCHETHLLHVDTRQLRCCLVAAHSVQVAPVFRPLQKDEADRHADQHDDDDVRGFTDILGSLCPAAAQRGVVSALQGLRPGCRAHACGNRAAARVGKSQSLMDKLQGAGSKHVRNLADKDQEHVQQVHDHGENDGQHDGQPQGHVEPQEQGREHVGTEGSQGSGCHIEAVRRHGNRGGQSEDGNCGHGP